MAEHPGYLLNRDSADRSGCWPVSFDDDCHCVLAQSKLASHQAVAAALADEHQHLWCEATRFWPLSGLATKAFSSGLGGSDTGANALVRDNRHDSAYIFGAICPARGVGAAIITPCANTEMMNLHLEEISAQVGPNARAVLLSAAVAALQSGTEPDGEYLGLLAAEQALLHRME